MLNHKKIKVGKIYIEAVCIRLQSKNFVLLRGKIGYIMCGYLDLKIAEKFNDVAVRIEGVASIPDALKSQVRSCTSQAKKLGIYPGQPVKEVLKIIA